MKLPKRRWLPSFKEIHEYTQDLQRVSVLRDKCPDGGEKDRYNDCIHVMQEVLIFLNTQPGKKKTK